MTTLEPLGDRVVLKPPAEPDKVGAIYLPDISRRIPREGTVVAVGEGKRLDSGELVKPKVSVGDYVAIPDYSFMSLAVEGETYWIVEGKDILVILRDATLVIDAIPNVTESNGESKVACFTQ